MMSLVEIVVLSIHFTLLLMLCLFGLHRLSMVVRWLRHGNRYKKANAIEPAKFDELPSVTVQIPIYNEMSVAKRVIDAIAAIDYPRDKLQLQIVDDSTDLTSDIIAERIDYYHQKNIPIEHVRRSNRDGFKAGALKESMENASGDFIAIFDADFLPDPNILKTTIHHFSDDNVGMLQCRWEHLNRKNSRLTELQSIMLDAHFGLEQQVRSFSNLFLNFNGTAGIWRKSTIIDAGNWSADTLTEDLDLSYRAQLKGWKMRYLNDISCPAEVPSDMNAFKSQQHRWAKGGTEVMLKMLRTVWKSPVSLRIKLESTFHLSNNLAYLVLLIDTLFFLLPSVWIREQYQIEYIWLLDLPLLIISSTGHLIYLVFGQFALGRSKIKTLLNIPWLMLLGIQISFNNARAAFEALIGQRSEFVRTPKSGELCKNSEQSSAIKRAKPSYMPVAPKGAIYEFFLGLIFIAIFCWCLSNQLWLMLPFIVFLIVGYISTSLNSFVSYQRLKS